MLTRPILAPIINPVYGDTVINSLYADAVCFLFKDGDFPLKRTSSINVSKLHNQSAAVHKAIIHKSVNSFVARKPVNVVSRNFVRPDCASKPVCIVPSKPVKCKVASEPVFNVSSKPVKTKVAYKPAYNVPSKPVESKVPSKTIFDVPKKSVKLVNCFQCP